MRRTLLALAASAALIAPASAQVGMPWPGPGTVHAAAYTGPGDLATFSAWYGLRAFKGTDRGQKLINACDSTGGTDVACADMLSDATTGALVPATIGGITCPGTNCTVKTAYEKSGSGVGDATQATVANRPALLSACLTPVTACMVWTNRSTQYLTMTTGSGNTLSQPFSMYTVATKNGDTQSTNTFGGSNNGGGNAADIGQDSTADQVHCKAGTALTVSSVSSSLWHVTQFLANGATNSDCTIDGTSHTGNAGTGSVDLRLAVGGLNYVSPQYLGQIVEVGIASGSIASLNSNAKTYWGF